MHLKPHTSVYVCLRVCMYVCIECVCLCVKVSNPTCLFDVIKRARIYDCQSIYKSINESKNSAFLVVPLQ